MHVQNFVDVTIMQNYSRYGSVVWWHASTAYRDAFFIQTLHLTNISQHAASVAMRLLSHQHVVKEIRTSHFKSRKLGDVRIERLERLKSKNGSNACEYGTHNKFTRINQRRLPELCRGTTDVTCAAGPSCDNKARRRTIVTTSGLRQHQHCKRHLTTS